VCSLRLGFQPYPQTLDYPGKNLPGVNTLAYFGTEGKKSTLGLTIPGLLGTERDIPADWLASPLAVGKHQKCH